MFLLDTDHLGSLQRGSGTEYERIRQRTAAHSQKDFYVSIVSFHEQVLGWNAYIGRAREVAGVVRGYAMFERLLTEFAAAQVLPLGAEAGTVFGELRNRRIRIPTMDLRIASVALANNVTLLTRNLRDFSKVPGLKLEDWTS